MIVAILTGRILHIGLRIVTANRLSRLSQVLINLRVGKINPSMNKKSEMLELVERFSDLRFGDQAHRGEKRAIHAPYVVVGFLRLTSYDLSRMLIEA